MLQPVMAMAAFKFTVKTQWRQSRDADFPGSSFKRGCSVKLQLLLLICCVAAK